MRDAATSSLLMVRSALFARGSNHEWSAQPSLSEWLSHSQGTRSKTTAPQDEGSVRGGEIGKD